MKLTATQKWLRTIAWLRRNFPATRSAYVQSVSMAGLHGYTQLEAGYFQVKINSKKSFALKIDTLIHEWAHALTWFGAEMHNEDHSAEWGIQYAKIYRMFCEWDFGTGEMRENEEG